MSLTVSFLCSSLLGFLLIATDFLFNGELAALDGHEDVGVLCCGCHELRYDKLSVLARAHTQGLEALQTVLIVNLKLLQCESSMLDKIAEESCILNWLDHFFSFWEIFDRNT